MATLEATAWRQWSSRSIDGRTFLDGRLFARFVAFSDGAKRGALRRMETFMRTEFYRPTTKCIAASVKTCSFTL